MFSKNREPTPGALEHDSPERQRRIAQGLSFYCASNLFLDEYLAGTRTLEEAGEGITATRSLLFGESA